MTAGEEVSFTVSRTGDTVPLVSSSSEDREKAIRDAAAPTIRAWGLLFLVTLFAGLGMFIAFFVLSIIHTGEDSYLQYLILMLAGAAVILLSLVFARVLRNARETCEKEVKLMKIEHGEYLLKTDIASDQWVNFHYFASQQHMMEALASAVMTFLVLAFLLCLNLYLRTRGYDLEVPGVWYGYVIAADFALCLFGFTIASIVILVRRNTALTASNRSVYLFKDAALYEGFFLNWQRPNGHENIGITYLNKISLIRNETAGCLIKLEITKKSGRRTDNKVRYLPVAEQDLAKAKTAIAAV